MALKKIMTIHEGQFIFSSQIAGVAQCCLETNFVDDMYPFEVYISIINHARLLHSSPRMEKNTESGYNTQPLTVCVLQ